MLVARRDELKRIEVTLGIEPVTTWQLETMPDASGDQKAMLAAWTGIQGLQDLGMNRG